MRQQENESTDGTLYVFSSDIKNINNKNINSINKNADAKIKMLAAPRSNSKSVVVVNNRQVISASARQPIPVQSSNNNKNTEYQRQSPVKRLAKKFKRGGLGTIDSYFNAYFFYYQWKFDKANKAKKDSGEYGKNLRLLEHIAKIWGFILSLFAPFGDASKNIKYLAKKTCAFLVPAASVALTLMMMININAYRPELELALNGQIIGFIDSKETVGTVISLLENNISSVLNEPYEFTGDFDYRLVLTKNGEKPYVSENELYDFMYQSSQTVVTSAYGLYIDGELIGAAESVGDIDSVLTAVLEANMSVDGDEIIEFANDIRIVENKYPTRDLRTHDELKNIMTNAVEGSDAAVETSRDNISEATESEEDLAFVDNIVPLSLPDFSNFSDFSDVFGSADSIESTESIGSTESTNSTQHTNDDMAVMAVASSLNPTPEAKNAIPRGFLESAANNSDDRSQSDLLARLGKTSANAIPGVIQLKKIKTEIYSLEVPFEIEYKDSSQYYTGTQTVQTNGVNGEHIITADVTYIDEKEISREIKEIEVIKAPVNKVVIVGTKPLPTTVPSGNFIRPVKGGYYTSRYTGGHRALDLVVPFGTQIVASDAGTVIYAGSSGSYGNHVKIRHDDGYVTLYAHMADNSICVSYGDKVYQGQEIGKVGSTGRSTGNHLHFEIIKNGVQQNPELYIK